MRTVKFAVIILLIVTLNACSFSNNRMTDAEAIGAQDKEDTDMKNREFCRVISEENGILGLVNVAGETYNIDSSIAPDIHLNDNVLLIYNSRKLQDNGIYSADVYAVFHDDPAIVTPKR